MSTTRSRLSTLRTSCAAVGAALLLVASAPASHAADPGSAESRATGSARDGKQVRNRYAVCEARPDHPHWSRNGKSVIFKTRVSCRGTFPRVHVKVRGQLVRNPGSSKARVVAVSNQTQVLPTNGSGTTYYTPKPRGTKVKKSGRYQGRVTIQITSPAPGSVGSARSKVANVTVP